MHLWRFQLKIISSSIFWSTSKELSLHRISKLYHVYIIDKVKLRVNSSKKTLKVWDNITSKRQTLMKPKSSWMLSLMPKAGWHKVFDHKKLWYTRTRATDGYFYNLIYNAFRFFYFHLKSIVYWQTFYTKNQRFHKGFHVIMQIKMMWLACTKFDMTFLVKGFQEIAGSFATWTWSKIEPKPSHAELRVSPKRPPQPR